MAIIIFIDNRRITKNYPYKKDNPARLSFLSYMKILPRMFGCQNVSLFRDSNVRVDLGDVDGTVSQHFLNVSNVNVGL